MKEQDELNLLAELKNKLIEIEKKRGNCLKDDDFGSVRWEKSEKKEFYFYDLRKNLFEIPNKTISLGTGVEAIRSSAAMIFNTLGQGSVIFNGEKYNTPKYEQEFTAIIDDDKKEHNAHLDAVLYSADEKDMIAIEAKMLEWINSPKNLHKAYVSKENYVSENKKREVFINFFNSLKNNKIDKDNRFCHETKRYDSIQMTIHILSLYNYCCTKVDSVPKNIKLLNVVWNYDCEDYKIEEKEGKEFVKKANEAFAPLFTELGVDFSIEYTSYSEFIKSLTLSPERSAYLGRYMIQQ